MKLTADYHLHSSFSGDSDTPMEQMIEQGIALGLQQICFTDHMDYEYPKQYMEEGLIFEFDVDAYFQKIEKMKSRYQGQIEILAGIELGIKPELAPRLNQLVESYPFDFVIASSHLLDNYDPYFPDYWKTIHNDADYAIRRYFQSIKENVEAFSNFDVYGHLDYIVRYVPDSNYSYEPERYQEEIDAMLLAIIQAGKGIEINTAGLKYGLPFAHPKQEILARFLELGGKYFTVGSDAHKPEHMAFDFEKEAALLENIDTSKYAIFKQRNPVFVSC